jgi:hypothetical protein
MAGRADSGRMVWTPPPSIWKPIVFEPGWAFESRMACRSEPSPASLVLVTR